MTERRIPHIGELGRFLGEAPSLAEPSRHRYELHIGPEVFRFTEECIATYDEDGSSTLKFKVPDDGLVSDGALDTKIVRLLYGQEGGHLEEYFRGKLAWADEDEETGLTVGEAFGPLRVMRGQFWDTPRRFRGVNLNNYFAAVQEELYERGARIEVVGGQAYYIEDAPIRPEISLYESSEKFVKPAGFVMADRPGYIVRVLPEPRPGIAGGVVATITGADVPPGGLVVEESKEMPRYKVVVFASNRDGSIKWRAESKINHKTARPAPNSIHWIPDFDGDASTGQQVAWDTAAAAAVDQYGGSVKGMPGNPYIHLFDPLAIVRETRAGYERPRRRIEYRARVKTVTLDAKAGVMDFDFRALKKSETAIRESTRPIEIPSYLIPSPFVPPAGMGEDAGGFWVTEPHDGDPWFGEDAGGIWIDLDLAGDRAGEDSGGLWVDLDKVNGV